MTYDTSEEKHRDRQLAEQLDSACILHQNGELAKAETAYRGLLSVVPQSWQLRYNYGLLLYECGRFEEAADIYYQAVAGHQDDADLYFNLGLCCKRLGRYDEAIDAYHRALSLEPEQLDTLYNLACCYQAAERYQDAERTYEHLLQQEPGHLPALNNLAYLSHCVGNNSRAVELYRLVLSVRPDSPSAEHMLAALTGTTRSSVPSAYVKEVFDYFADHYETSLLDNLHYFVPDKLHTLVTATGGGDRCATLLDLGCGTGLIGERFAAGTTTLHGVDLSEKMLAIAARKGCYDALFCAEISEFLQSSAAAVYDLIIAADVFNYVGHPGSIFEQAARVVCKGGRFFFSIELLAEHGASMHLAANGRFAHADQFIRDCAEHHGWRIDCAEQVDLRTERDSWVAGVIYGMTKKS